MLLSCVPQGTSDEIPADKVTMDFLKGDWVTTQADVLPDLFTSRIDILKSQFALYSIKGGTDEATIIMPYRDKDSIYYAKLRLDIHDDTIGTQINVENWGWVTARAWKILKAEQDKIDLLNLKWGYILTLERLLPGDLEAAFPDSVVTLYHTLN